MCLESRKYELFCHPSALSWKNYGLNNITNVGVTYVTPILFNTSLIYLVQLVWDSTPPPSPHRITLPCIFIMKCEYYIAQLRRVRVSLRYYGRVLLCWHFISLTNTVVLLLSSMS